MADKKKLIVANFKMNLVLKFELDSWIKKFIQSRNDISFNKTNIILCPSAVHLMEFIEKVKNKSVAIGAQDCFWERKGSFTGGISATTIKSLGGEYVILGHSERKKYFGETEEAIALKLKVATSVGLKSVLCVGESVDEKKKDLTSQSLREQMEKCLKEFPQGQLDRLLICYEPVWAISSNNPINLPTTDEIMTARLVIKKILVNKYGASLANKVRMLYGGSVNQRNIENVCLDAGMDGVLAGKASLIPNELLGIAKKIEK